MFDHQPQGKSAAAGRKPGAAQQRRWSEIFKWKLVSLYIIHTYILLTKQMDLSWREYSEFVLSQGHLTTKLN